MATINYPQAYELMSEALTQVILKYPLADRLVLIENVGLESVALDSNRVFYDPSFILNYCLNDLIDVVTDAYISYYLTCVVPVCSLSPLSSQEPVLH